MSIHPPLRFRCCLFQLLLTLTLTSGCSNQDQANGHNWPWSDKTPDSIIIGVVNQPSQQKDLLLQGVRLAAHQINQSGGLNSRPIKIIHEVESEQLNKNTLPDESEADNGRLSAQKMLPYKPLAIIGHGSSDSAQAASVVYGDNDIIFLLPYASNENLTNYHRPLVLRLIPSNFPANRALARYASSKKLCNLLVLALNNNFGKESAMHFSNEMDQLGGNIVFSTYFDRHARDFELLLLNLLDRHIIDRTKLDAIYISGYEIHIKNFIPAARRLGINQPILATESISTPSVIEHVKKNLKDAMLNTITFNGFDDSHPSAAQTAFKEAFENRYQQSPNYWAALGFDTVNLIAQAIMDRATTDPEQLSIYLHSLRYTQPFQGVLGDYRFTLSGDLIKDFIAISQFRQGRFHVVDEIALNQAAATSCPIASSNPSSHASGPSPQIR
jgi:branched-chain amino acid transport system substrate-binding protein